MAESDQPIGLVVKLPFGSEQEFLQRYGANLSRGGIYLRAKGLKPPGTPVTLEVKLQSGARLLYASAVVEFVTGAQEGIGIPGMGLRFVTVDAATQRFLDTAALVMPHAKLLKVPLPRNVGPPDTSPSAVPAPTPPSQEQAPLPSQQSGRLVISGDDGSLKAPAFVPSPLPPREGPILGIDLGTTNSCAAIVLEGKPQVIKSREGYNTVPSVVALSPRGKLMVGHAAKAQLLTNPKLTVYGAKRLVGRAYDSATVQEIKDRFTYVVCEGAEGEAAVRLADQIFSLEEISALILREVRELASAQLKVPVCRAVITVPAWYNDNQRQAVRKAGALAGLHVERIVNEPTAAALAYAWGRKLSQRVLVYDLGGGTFDASVLELSDTVYEVLSTGGDTFLGGLDFDGMIVAWILEQFAAKHGKPFVGDRVGTQRLNDAAERAKIALSERSEARLHVPFATLIDNAPVDIDLTLTRQQLEVLVGGLVDRTSSVVREVLESKGLQPKDIDEVLLVGGQSRSPLVQEKLTAFFGRPPAKAVHPDEAVALGAAVLAHALQKQEGLVLIDVLPQSVGVGLPGGRFYPVIRRNTALPVSRKHTHATTRDNQEQLALSVFQGESPRAQDNEFLGTLKLQGLPKGPKGSVRVEITFELSNEGLLKLKAREGSSGAKVEAVLATRDTPEAVRAALETDAGGAPPEGSDAAQPPAPEPTASEAGKKGGFFGWLKGVFGRP